MAPNTLYQDLVVTKNKDCTATLEGAIPFSIIELFKKEVIRDIKERTEIPGFRKGHVPEKMLIDRIGELHIIEEAAEEALKEIVPGILRNEKLDVIGRPLADLTKVAPGNPVTFKVTVSLFPEFTLPDYKKIAKETLLLKKEMFVDEKDIKEAVKEIRKMRATKDGGEVKEDSPITDDEAKTFGPFASADDFKEKLTENIKKEKDKREKERVRLLILDTVGKQTSMIIPEILIEGEIDRMLSYFKDDISRIGITFEEYLKKINKTEADMRKEWRPDAENRARFELIMNKIGELEEIKATEEEIEHEVTHLKEHVSDVNPTQVRPYIAHQIRTQKIFEFLEGQNTLATK